MIDYTSVYCEHTPLVKCSECKAVLEATDRDTHQAWHDRLARLIRPLPRKRAW